MKLTSLSESEYESLPNIDNTQYGLPITYGDQELIIRFNSRHAAAYTLDNRISEKSEEILQKLTKEINLPWIPNLQTLITSFPTTWISLLQDPPNFDNTKPIEIYYYAKYFIKCRIPPQAEERIATDAFVSYRYAVDVINGRFPAGEKAIQTDGNYLDLYLQYINK